jgi:hypothetical protein
MLRAFSSAEYWRILVNSVSQKADSVYSSVYRSRSLEGSFNEPSQFSNAVGGCPQGSNGSRALQASPAPAPGASHERALGTARHRGEPAGQIAARQIEVSRIGQARRGAEELPSDVAAAIEGEA